MTRFRCEGSDERGRRATRMLSTRDRDQAALLMLAEGITPTLIETDAPSLFERIGGRRRADGLAMLQDIAAVVRAGLSLPAAAASIGGEAARRIASGMPIHEALADGDLPDAVAAALARLSCTEASDAALVALADAATIIADRRHGLHAVTIETTALAMLALLLLAATSALGAAAAVTMTLAAIGFVRRRRGRVARSLADIATAERLATLSAVPDGDEPAIPVGFADRRAERAVAAISDIARIFRIAALTVIGLVLLGMAAR